MAKADRAGRAARRPATFIALGVIALALGGAGWMVANGPPLAGEPYAVVGIPAADTPPSGAETGDRAPPAGAPTPDASGQTPATAGEARLASAPVDGLLEQSRFGPLPRRADDGRIPATAYARHGDGPPADQPGGGPVRIALLVGGLGISVSATSEAIQRLPAAVSLGFAPYGNDLQTWVDRARSDGHEVMLQVPMEPFDYPDSDPGPHTLLTGLPWPENRERLHWLMGRFSGYFGVTNIMGAKFTASADAVAPLLEEIGQRGLTFLDDGASARSRVLLLAPPGGPPALRADVFIDATNARQGIADRLGRLETIAKETGQAVGVAEASPLLFDMLSEWLAGLGQRTIELVPVSAAATRRS
jgi:hypothetical protein